MFASPSKSRIRNLQSIGRGLRKSNLKKMATLYDIADDLKHKEKKNYTLEHYEERVRVYKEERFPLATYHIQLITSKKDLYGRTLCRQSTILVGNY